MSEHWNRMSRQWAQVGPPLRPCAKDLQFLRGVIGDAPGTRALILGVTPEFYHLACQVGANVIAVDRSQGMIDAVWPGPPTQAFCADWTQLPPEVGQRDVILCDGGLSVLAYPKQLAELAIELRRVLVRGGICAIRLYVPPAKKESVETVLADLLSRRIADVNQLKLRLWTALHVSAEIGVELNDIWETIYRVTPELEALAVRIGWPVEGLRAMEAYRGGRDRYYFPDVGEVSRVLCAEPGGFELQDVHVPDYELGERCPTIVLEAVG